jgi:hypothetical protein
MRKIFTLLMTIILLQGGVICLKGQTLASDSLALVDIYNAAGGPNWTSQGNWLTGKVSTWSGVTVWGNRVRKLTVGPNNMIGTLSSSIGNLTALDTVQINGNSATDVCNLTGSVPATLWNDTNISRLQVKFTNITGGIPSTGISKMHKLYEINFQGTPIGGTIPDSLFLLPSIGRAYLHQASLTGAVPSTLTSATNLVRLLLYGNNLTSLPFVNLPKANKCSVEIYGNRFSFADVKPYADVYASDNTWYGSYKNNYQFAKDSVAVSVIAGSKYAMHGLVTGGETYSWFKDAATTPIGSDDSLIISSAALTDSGRYMCTGQSSLVSAFDIRTIYNLKVKELSKLASDSLALVDIYNAAGGPNWTNKGNWLTGNISTWTGVHLRNNRVTKLVFDELNTTVANNASGTLSSSIGNLTALDTLQVNGVSATARLNLTGSVPATLWNDTNIRRVQIKFTNLTGGIPSTGLSRMHKLYEINFQGTPIGGTIPDSLFTLSTLGRVYLHQASLTGAVPTTLAQRTNLYRLLLYENKLTSIPFVNLPKSAKCSVGLRGNYFSFADVKSYADSSANYTSGYDNAYQFAQDTTKVTADERTSYTLSLQVADAGSYTWFKDIFTTNSTTIATDSTNTYTIKSLVVRDSGTYECKVQSSQIANFDIRAEFIIKVNPVTIEIPTIASTETNALGTNINVTFSKTMNDPSTFTSDFTVKVNGTAVTINAVSLDASNSKIVVIELTDAVKAGDVILISYVGTDVTSTEGGILAPVIDQAVTNNSTITSITATSIAAFTIYPNPCTDKIIIRSSEKVDFIGIYDITGKIVLELKNVNGSVISVPVANLQQGTYMMSIRSANSSTIQKIIKK